MFTEEQQIALALPGVTCTFGGRSIVPDIAVFIGNGFPQMTMVLLLTALMLTNWTIEILS